MMSLDAIREISQQAGQLAADEGKEPFVFWNAEEVDELGQGVSIPNLGDYTPYGWERSEDQWFVDKSGWGKDSEPALTPWQFKAALKAFLAEHPGDTWGFAMTEEGQFQVYVTAFRRVRE